MPTTSGTARRRARARASRAALGDQRRDRLAQLVGDAEFEPRGTDKKRPNWTIDRIVEAELLAQLLALLSSGVSWPTIWLTGSPTKRNSMKAISATVSMTTTAWNSAAEDEGEHDRSFRLRQWRNGSIDGADAAWASGTGSPTSLQSFVIAPVEQDRVVGALHHLDLLGHAPGQRLLVQRDVAGLVVADLEGLRDQLVALGVVGLDQDLVGRARRASGCSSRRSWIRRR